MGKITFNKTRLSKKYRKLPPDTVRWYLSSFPHVMNALENNKHTLNILLIYLFIRVELAQHRILYFGIIGALLFRAIFVAAGTSLFGMSTWVELIFALIVAWTAYVMFRGSSESEEQTDYSNHWSVKFTRKLMPVSARMYKNKFVVKGSILNELDEKDGLSQLYKPSIYYVTPMFLCLMCVEISDIVFSFDSVPAIIAITKEPLLVYSAVIFAILGLRNLYFMLAAAARYLCHLEKSVALILVFIAIKLGASSVEKIFGFQTFHIPHDQSLYVVIGLIGFGIIASILFPEKTTSVEQ